MPEAVAPAAPQNGAPRNNAGQFSPKDGATGVTKDAPAGAAPVAGAPPPSGPQSVEDWSLEGELDVYGEKQKVTYKSKAEALRDLQVAAALKKRVRDIQEAERRVQEREQSLGPQLTQEQREEQFRRQVIQRAQMQEMTPEQRENFQLKQQLAQFQRAQQEAQRAEGERQQQAAKAQLRQHAVEGLEKGLELSGLPKTHVSMGLLAEIQAECAEQGLPPLPPDLLAQEANKRYAERGIEPLKALKGQALLDRLTPDIVREVLAAEWQRRGKTAAQPRQPTITPDTHRLPDPTDDKVMGEAEAEAALRAMRNNRFR